MSWAGRALRRSRVTALVVLMLVVLAPQAAAALPSLTFSDPRIFEPSGLATDTKHKVYWTVNETSAAATSVFAVNAEGTTVARYTLGTPARSVQALAYSGDRLYIADIGDPQLTRSSVTISMATLPGTLVDSTVAFRQWDIGYPDGRHDGQALLLGPNDQMYIVTGGSDPAIYKAPTVLSSAAPVRSVAPNKLTRVAAAPKGVTDGFMTADHVYLRTATEVILLDPTTFAEQSRAPLPTQQDGKGIARSLDGTQLLLTGRGAGAEVLTMRDPASPAADSTQPSGSVPIPSTTTQVVVEPSGGAADRTGTFVAIGAAVLLALVAAAVTFFRR